MWLQLLFVTSCRIHRYNSFASTTSTQSACFLFLSPASCCSSAYGFVLLIWGMSVSAYCEAAAVPWIILTAVDCCSSCSCSHCIGSPLCLHYFLFLQAAFPDLAIPLVLLFPIWKLLLTCGSLPAATRPCYDAKCGPGLACLACTALPCLQEPPFVGSIYRKWRVPGINDWCHILVEPDYNSGSSTTVPHHCYHYISTRSRQCTTDRHAAFYHVYRSVVLCVYVQYIDFMCVSTHICARS